MLNRSLNHRDTEHTKFHEDRSVILRALYVSVVKKLICCYLLGCCCEELWKKDTETAMQLSP